MSARTEKAKAPKLQLTPAEDAAIKRVNQRAWAAGPSPNIKIETKGNSQVLSNTHREPAVGEFLLMDAFGTGGLEFSQDLVRQLIDLSSEGRNIDERRLNFAVTAIRAARPRDEIEAMLLCQMVAVHLASMKAASQLARAGMIPQYDSTAAALTKLSRTYALQTEALSRYRSAANRKASTHESTKAQTVARAAKDDARGRSNGTESPAATRSARRSVAKARPSVGLTTH